MFWERKEENHKKFEAHMDLASKWINHLHNTDREHHRKHDEIVNYLHHMHGFIHHLKNENEELKKNIQELRANSVSRNEIRHLNAPKEISIDTKPIENAIFERLRLEIPKHEEKIVERIVEIPQKMTQKEEKITKTETSMSQMVHKQDFTYSEKQVLNVLFSAESPLSYEAIGARLNKKSGTIKVYVNDLKKKGIDLEEFDGPGNIKLYALTNKEKVEKLYNLSVV